MKIAFLCVTLFAGSSAFGDMITVFNETTSPIFAAVYCKTPKASASKSTDILSIAPNESAELDRTSGSWTCRRQLVVTVSRGKLTDSISDSNFKDTKVFGNASLGTSSGDVSRLFHKFYVSGAADSLSIANTAAHRISKIKSMFGDAVDAAVSIYKSTLLPTNPAVIANKFSTKDAEFRASSGLAAEERAYLGARTPKVKTALERFLNQRLNGRYIPKIAFIASGGGARAMLCTTGWHDGAEQIGLLNALTYDVGLSGGTWGIGYWLASGLSLADFEAQLKAQMLIGVLPITGLESGTVYPTKSESWLMLQAMLAKMSYDQPVGLVDFYGSALANRFLSQMGNTRQVFALHDLADKIGSGDLPMPIFTAINADDGTHEANRHLARWVEFTPYEIGAKWLGGFIPSWAYGRAFEDNRSIDFAPPQSFGFQTGTYGSAFAFDFRRAMEEVIGKATDNAILRQAMISMIETIANDSAAEFGAKRMSTAKVNNFAKDAPDADADVRTKDILRFGDGGLAFNLPYPPVSGERPERMADIMIFLDASGSLEANGSDEMELVTKYAKAKGLKLPPVTIKGLASKPVSVFMNENDPTSPVVIYIPRKLEDTNKSTLKFVYDNAEFDSMISLTRNQMIDSAATIREAIKKKIRMNNGF